MRIYVGQINPIVGEIAGNSQKILNGIAQAKDKGADVALFPELALSGYLAQDLFLLPHFMDAIEAALQVIAAASYGLTVLVGLPRRHQFKVGKPLYNSVAVISDGNIVGYYDKNLLPTYDVFEERRYFEPGAQPVLWDIADGRAALTICEDIWLHSDLLLYDRYTGDPIKQLLALPERPRVLFNLSASPFSVAKPHLRLLVAQRTARALCCPVIFCNQVGANDSLIFDGSSLAVSHEGNLIRQGASFKEEGFVVDLSAPNPTCLFMEVDVLEELFHALILGIRDYFTKTGFTSACLGLSGGIDSAVVACLAVEALGKDNVLAIAMPSRFSSHESSADAKALADNLGMRCLDLPIEEPFTSFLKLFEPHFEGKEFDITEENLQARIRGTILMAFANKFGHLLLNTGNKSELAVGYCTLYGDMCGSLSVIGDLTKRRVYALAQWINHRGELIPTAILHKAPSAELRHGQLDSDTLPDYEYIDTVVEEYLEYHNSPEKIAALYGFDLALVETIIAKIHHAEYKRRQAPIALRVTEKSFSLGYRFPIVQRWV